MLAHLDSGEEELPSSVLEAAVMETVRRQIEADMQQCLAVLYNVYLGPLFKSKQIGRFVLTL